MSARRAPRSSASTTSARANARRWRSPPERAPAGRSASSREAERVEERREAAVVAVSIAGPTPDRRSPSTLCWSAKAAVWGAQATDSACRSTAPRVGCTSPDHQRQQRRLARTGATGDHRHLARGAAPSTQGRRSSNQGRSRRRTDPRRRCRPLPRHGDEPASAVRPAADPNRRMWPSSADAIALPAIRASVRSESGRRTQPRPSTTSDAAPVHRLFADPTVVDGEHSGGDPLGPLVVRHDEQRCARALGVLAKEVVHLVGAGRVELAGRLVGDHETRPVRECGSKGDTLALSTGQ